jgi:hypothetical protein
LFKSVVKGREWRFALFVAILVIAGALVYRPALSMGYVSDDYLQNAMLDGEYPVPRSALDLYSFVKPGELGRVMDLGIVPWWSHPDLKLSALRPLSSALLWLDHRLLGLSPYAQHVHSLLWWAALVVAFAVFCRRLLSPRVAAFAIVLFAFDPAHLIPILWIANRTALVSAFFGLIGLHYYIRFRQEAALRPALASGMSFALALAGGEYGLCALAYVATYELYVATDPWRARLKAWLPAALPALAYVVLYAVLGFGAAASAAYVSPLAAPSQFLADAKARLPSLLANELLTLPAEVVFPALSLDFKLVLWLVPPLLLIALLAFGTVRRAEPREARLLGCFGVGMLVAMLPLIGTVPGTRLLLIPSIGGSVLIGALCADVWSRAREVAEWKRPLFWARALLMLPLFIYHAVIAAPANLLSATMFRDGNQFIRDVFAAAEIDDSVVTRQDLIVVNAPDPLTLLYVPRVRRELKKPAPRVWRALSMTPRPVRVERVGIDTLELSVAGGSLTEMPLAALVRRADLRLSPGEVISIERLSIQVLEVGELGPERVRFKFSESLDSDSICLLVLSPAGLMRMAPLPVGGELTTPGLMAPKVPGM